MSSPKPVPSNADPKKYNDYSLQLSRWFLVSIGASPQTRTTSIIERLSSIVLIIVLSSAIAAITIPGILYVFLEAKGIQMKLSPLVPLFHRIMGFLIYLILLSHGKAIHKCMKHMEEDWRVVQKMGDFKVMVKHAKMGRYMAGICAAFMHSSSAFFNISATMKTVTFVINNVSKTIHPLSCPAYRKLVDARFSPANEIMMTMQFTSSYLTNSATVCICSLGIAFAMHACGQLNMLCTWFNELIEDHAKGNHLAEEKLASIVKHHMRVFFIAYMENIMYKACFLELAECTINMCLVGYYSVMNWSVLNTGKITAYLMVYISMAFNISIFCYIGQIVTEQSKEVGRMAYMTNWYKLDHKTARSFVLIIMRSNNAINITAGKICSLSIATFGNVIKTSFAYMNALQTMST
ncbi:PREDICTED: uncharacterized protein LOC106744601 [Dinoponera quadriceps]|uniref:Odorant receptor n=1 Tax=Dinoponera quadriceps TaxID=609295 RepID=A0A6P3X9M8_DINQU|nr:PREDICTED: uncharacterized protein LOC106744601 [Dinoponera quadriceps]